MRQLGRRQSLAALMLMAAACRAPRPAAPPPQHPSLDESEWPAPPQEEGLYSAQEALSDVLSGELEYIGTGRWPGVERSRACAFRNQRVLVVNAYCSPTEAPAFRVEVYSPERGRVRIYAETRGAVSARQRPDYFTFMVESSPPTSTAPQLPPLSLAMAYDDLRRYEQQRYEAYLPSCFGGEQNQQAVGACLGSLAASHDQWAAQNRGFLAQPNADWYAVIRKLRELAQRYGVNPVDQ